MTQDGPQKRDNHDYEAECSVKREVGADLPLLHLKISFFASRLAMSDGGTACIQPTIRGRVLWCTSRSDGLIHPDERPRLIRCIAFARNALG